MFLGCTTVYQDTDPICVSGENIPEQPGPEERREGNTDIPGLTQHGGGCPAEGQLATAAGFAHILPKNKHLQPRGPQGCLWVLERRRNLRCEFVWGCSGSRSERSKAHAQGTGGAVQINTEGFAFCSFMANVGMGTCQAGLLDRLLTDRSKRSSRGECRCGKFRKSLQSSRCPPKCTPGVKAAVAFAVPGVVAHVWQVNDKVVTVSGLKFLLLLAGLCLFACSVLSR